MARGLGHEPVIQWPPSGNQGDEPLQFRTTGSQLSSSAVCPNVINDGTGLMRYCCSRNIYADNSNVEHAIIVIHGSGLDAKNYYQKTLDEAVVEGVDTNKLDIIAPQYFEGSVPNYDSNPWTNYYVWNSTWRWGHLSPSHPTRPSFQGGNRNERWDNHRTHVADLCASEGYSGLYCLFHSARHMEVPGCGHGSSCSWASDEGHEILFGLW